MEKILLHTCCAVCLAHPIKELTKVGYEPIVYFCNPNIYPESEYLRRLEELAGYCQKMGYEYIIEDYNPTEWRKVIKGLEKEPEKGARCDKCFQYRLEKTAQKAKSMGIELFTTTLTVSPHKISKNIFTAGMDSAIEYGLTFLDIDFKKENGFLKTMEIAKKEDFYRQQYCGCEFSFRNF